MGGGEMLREQRVVAMHWAPDRSLRPQASGATICAAPKDAPPPRGSAGRSSHATFTLKPPAYLAGSLPSQTTPSRSFEVRMSSFETLVFAAAAACL
jgi:hypothetical protein